MSHWDILISVNGLGQMSRPGQSRQGCKGSFHKDHFPRWRQSCRVASLGVAIIQLSLQRLLYLSAGPAALSPGSLESNGLPPWSKELRSNPVGIRWPGFHIRSLVLISHYSEGNVDMGSIWVYTRHRTLITPKRRSWRIASLSS